MRIAVLKAEEGFPALGVPEGLTPEWIKQVLDAEGREAALVSPDEVNYLDPRYFELLILPYGEAFPEESIRGLLRYHNFGGSLFFTAGRGVWNILRLGPGGREDTNADAFEKVLAELGLKWYEVPVSPVKTCLDACFFQGLPAEIHESPGPFGIVPNTADGRPYARSWAGNCFPDRVPVRDWHTLAYGVDRFGKRIVSSIVLVKDWQRNVRHCFISQTGEGHILNPAREYAAHALRELVRLVSIKQVVFRHEPEMPCYRGEKDVKLVARVRNWSGKREPFTLRFRIEDESGREQSSQTLNLALRGRDTRDYEVTLPIPDAGDLFITRAELLDDSGSIIDIDTNGFVVWHDNIAKSRKSYVAGTHYFRTQNCKSHFFMGINYYESKSGELMWLRPNVAKLAFDFSSMAALGLDMVRPHYHHSKWFRDYLEQYMPRLEMPDPDYYEVASHDPMPGEGDLRVFDAFVYLCQKYGIVFEPDFFTLIPEEMGDPKGWSYLREAVDNFEKTKKCAEFASLISARYKDIPGVMWDIWNEPDYYGENMDRFIRTIRQAMRDAGYEGPIILGSFWDKFDLEGLLDYMSIHGYETHMFPAHIPYYAQEVWNNAGNDAWSEEHSRQVILYQFHAALGTGSCGYMPWGWTRQARLWNNGWNSERWDDELGQCARSDGTVKPAAHTIADLSRFMNSLELADRPVSSAEVVAVGRSNCLQGMSRICRALMPFHVIPQLMPPDYLAESQAKLVFVPSSVTQPSGEIIGGAHLEAERTDAKDIDLLSEQDWEHIGNAAEAGAVVCILGKHNRKLPGERLGSETFTGVDPSGAVDVTQWEVVPAGYISEFPDGEHPVPENLPPSYQWRTTTPRRWLWTVGQAYGMYSAIGGFAWSRAKVKLERPCDLLQYEPLSWQLLDWVGPGGFWTAEKNVWLWLDGIFLGEYFGWGEALLISVQLEPGEHELLALTRDPWFLGFTGRARFGSRIERHALSRTKYGEGLFIEFADDIPFVKEPGGSEYFKEVLEAAGISSPDIHTTWAEGYELPTTSGKLHVFVHGPGAEPEVVRADGFEMGVQAGGLLHSSNGRVFSVECAEFLRYKGRELLRIQGGSAMVIAGDGKDLESAERIYLKLREGKGSITLLTGAKSCLAWIIGPKDEKIVPKQVETSNGKVCVNFCTEELPYRTLLEIRR